MPDAPNIVRPKVDGSIDHIITQIRFRLRRLDSRRLGAISLAVVAALMTRGALSRASAIEASLGTRVPVAVATEPLTAGSIVSETQVAIEMWPAGLVPNGAYREFAAGAEAFVTSDIFEGEPLTQARLSSGNLGLGNDEVAVTLPQPLAPPPLQIGYQVKLVGVVGNPADQLARATILATGRVVALGDDGVTVAVQSTAMTRIVEHAAVGAVEVVVTPQRG